MVPSGTQILVALVVQLALVASYVWVLWSTRRHGTRLAALEAQVTALRTSRIEASAAGRASELPGTVYDVGTSSTARPSAGRPASRR